MMTFGTILSSCFLSGHARHRRQIIHKEVKFDKLSEAAVVSGHARRRQASAFCNQPSSRTHGESYSWFRWVQSSSVCESVRQPVYILSRSTQQSELISETMNIFR